MQLTALTAISPLDGRYRDKLTSLAEYFSEYGFLRLRVMIELKWFALLLTNKTVTTKSVSGSALKFLQKLGEEFSLEDAERIKEIESETKHDVKAIEYFIKEKIASQKELSAHAELIHFAATSEDINNLAYGLMLKASRNQLILPELEALIKKLQMMAKTNAAVAMLARTHGQPASPTTLGKELANFVARLERLKKSFLHLPIMGKMNGTVGNFNAHMVAFPEINWPEVAAEFVAELGLTYNAYTTQIEPHDALAEFCNYLALINTVLISLTRDLWSYLAFGYFKQKVVASEIGSSVMPHKINPIDFENAEGNLGLANALLKHFAEKLPISRLQRDLSDSTVLRNLGVAFSYALLAYQNITAGLEKLVVDEEFLKHELASHVEVLAEAIQTVMRKEHIAASYEKLKELTRGKKIDAASLKKFIEELPISSATKKELLQLTPLGYVGYAEKLAKLV